MPCECISHHLAGPWVNVFPSLTQNAVGVPTFFFRESESLQEDWVDNSLLISSSLIEVKEKISSRAATVSLVTYAVCLQVNLESVWSRSYFAPLLRRYIVELLLCIRLEGLQLLGFDASLTPITGKLRAE